MAKAKKEYIPDQIDKDWLTGTYGANGMEDAPILNPSHDDYEARMEWRREQMEKQKEASRYVTKDDVKRWLIILAVILAFIFIIYKAGQQPDAYNSAPTCDETGQC